MLRFKSLGSGSTGNATVVEASGLHPLRILVDCGLGIRQLSSRLAQAGLEDSDIDAIFITHEHSDHIGCARRFSFLHQVPVWMSRGTYEGIGKPDFGAFLRIARDGEPIDLGGMALTPFTVPHDAREPLQLTCSDGAEKLGILTDLGHETSHVLAHLAGCHALLLECNHDIELLAQSTYPHFLKKRIGGQYGHLSNLAAQSIASTLSHSGLSHLVAAHLSEQNNRPDLAEEAMRSVLGDCTDVVVADATSGSRWITV